MTTIETKRLVLRPYLSGDAAALFALMAHPDVTRFIAASPYTWEDAEFLVKVRVATQDAMPPSEPLFSFVVTRKTDGTFIGTCLLGREENERTRGYVAYFLHSDFWGNGYATEAARALLAYGFQNTDIDLIFAVCVPENAASFRVMEKVGMRETDPLTFYAKNGNWYQGAFRDVTYRQCVLHRSDFR